VDATLDDPSWLTSRMVGGRLSACVTVIAPTVSAGVVKTCDGSVLMLGSSPPVVADVAFLLPGSALDRWVLPFPTQTPGFAYNPLFGVHTEDIASLSVNEFSNACFVRGADGTVWCSGSNPVGQLGNGGTTASNFPRRVAKLEGMADVSILGATTCALGRVGDVWCWGDNAFGGLGNGTSGGFSATPQPVAGLSSGAVELTRCARTPSGSIYCPTGPCARTAAGGVLCWGVGDGRGQQLTVPAPVQGLQGVARLGGSSCAVLDTGRVACWRRREPSPPTGREPSGSLC